MIPRAYIVEWRANAPWKSDAQVEQDLIIRHLESQGLRISWEQLQRNLLLKIKDRNFLIDTQPLLRPDISYSAEEAYSLLEEKLLNLLA